MGADSEADWPLYATSLINELADAMRAEGNVDGAARLLEHLDGPLVHEIFLKATKQVVTVHLDEFRTVFLDLLFSEIPEH